MFQSTTVERQRRSGKYHNDHTNKGFSLAYTRPNELKLFSGWTHWWDSVIPSFPSTLSEQWPNMFRLRVYIMLHFTHDAIKASVES